MRPQLILIVFFAIISQFEQGHFARADVEVAVGTKSSRPQQPQASVDANGVIHVVYGVGNAIRYARSTNLCTTFSHPSQLPSPGVLSLGMRRGPRVAAGDGFVSVTAIGGPIGLGRDGDVLCWHTLDHCKNWLGPTRVNDVPDSAREGLHSLAVGPQGELGCVWLDLRNGKTEFMAATSRDHGATWSANVLVYRSPDGSVCECCHPSTVFDAQGRLHVLWRNSLDGFRDMYVAISDDGGRTFGTAKKMGEGGWMLDACPMDGGAIACKRDGSLCAVWRRENSIYLANGDTSHEHLLGEGEQPWLTATAEGPYVVWLTNRGKAAMWVGPKNKAPTELAQNAIDPVIATSPFHDGPVVALWEGREPHESYSIRCELIGMLKRESK